LSKPLQITITLDDERIFDLLEENDIKPSKAKVTKLKKLFREVESDYYDELEEALTECLNEIAQEEWGE
jgi:hypothetical protein